MRKLFILTLFLCFSHSIAFSQSGFMKNVSDNFGKTSGCKSIKKENLFKTYKISGFKRTPNLKINNLFNSIKNHHLWINFSKNFYSSLSLQIFFSFLNFLAPLGSIFSISSLPIIFLIK